MGQALYRKYRSKKLDEVVGQEHVTETLAAALKQGRINHAYLFTGPRGVGKTSVARILAHEINGLPYDHEDNHIDIIEIDAASNRGIDEIRDLREKVYMAPVSAKYKVYIIDEVHMLTTPAFNALLKTLEEPPEHVVFILATTEAHKLPETIVSRTQRYTFRPVEKSKVVGHLKHIAKQEKIKVNDDALELFADHGGGSFRDSISLLDQAGSRDGQVDRQTAESMLGIPPESALATLADSLSSGQPASLIELLDGLYGQGFRPEALAGRLGDYLRQELLDGRPSLGAESQLRLLRRLLDVAGSSDPARLLEICLLEAMPDTIRPTVVATPAPAPVQAAPEPEIQAIEPTDEPASEAKAKPQTTKVVSANLADLWPKLLDSLKADHNTLYGIMRMAQPSLNGGTLTLGFKFSFHQKRMNEAKHRKIVEDSLESLTGQTIKIECVHDKDAVPLPQPIGANLPEAAPPLAEIPPSSLATISNIFGGGELLES